MFFGEVCEISKNTFFTEHLRTTASRTFNLVAKCFNFYLLVFNVQKKKKENMKLKKLNCQLKYKNISTNVNFDLVPFGALTIEIQLFI